MKNSLSPMVHKIFFIPYAWFQTFYSIQISFMSIFDFELSTPEYEVMRKGEDDFRAERSSKIQLYNFRIWPRTKLMEKDFSSIWLKIWEWIVDVYMNNLKWAFSPEMEYFSDIVGQTLLRYTFLESTRTNFAELIAPRSVISASERECIYYIG